MVCSLLPPPRLTGRSKLEAEGMFSLKAKPGPGMCVVKGCRHKHITKKRGGNLCLCAGCYQARWRMQNPKQSSYHTLKMHAKQRGLEFRVSFDYFRCLLDVAAHLYPSPDGFKDQISIDRVDPAKGYIEGNLTVLTVSENVLKGHRERHLPASIQAVLARKRAKAWEMSRPHDGDPENPF